jgi:hypothetical protein
VRFLSCVLLLTLGCGAAQRTAPAAPDDSWVLLDPAALLFAEPSEGAASIRAASSEVAALRLRARGELGLYRLVRDAGDWLEVETPGPVEDQCADPAPELLAFRLRLFARAADAARVTTRRVRLAFDDGTSVTLLAGVPLSSEGVALPAQLGLHAALPADSVGRWFTGGGRLDLSGRERFVPGERLDMLTVGGVPLRPLPDGRVAGGPGVYDSHAVPAGTLLLLRTRCAELQALGNGELVKPISKSADSSSESPPELKPPIARAGATVYWQSGRVAGELRRDIDFLDEAVGAGGRRCFRWSPRRKHAANVEGRLTLCFDAASIR